MDLFSLPKLETFSQHTTVYIDPTKLDIFWEAITPFFEKTSAEPECLYFEVFEDPALPGKVTWVVNWDASPQWGMTEYIKKGYYQPYLEATESLFVKPREIRILKRETPFVAGKTGNFERTIGIGNEGISLHVTIELRPECVEEFWDEWRKVYPPVVGEPECLLFEVFSDPTQPGKLSWIENWAKGAEWLMTVQLPRDYYKPYFAITEPMYTAPRAFSVLKRKEGFVAWRVRNFVGSHVGDFRG